MFIQSVQWLGRMAGRLFAQIQMPQQQPPNFEPIERNPMTIPYLVSFIAVVIILLVICVPTRKQP